MVMIIFQNIPVCKHDEEIKREKKSWDRGEIHFIPIKFNEHFFRAPVDTFPYCLIGYETFFHSHYRYCSVESQLITSKRKSSRSTDFGVPKQQIFLWQ